MIRRIRFRRLLLALAAAARAGFDPDPGPDRARPPTPAAPSRPPTPPAQPTEQSTAPQIQIIDTVVGKGKEATVGSTVTVNYTGWFYKPLAHKQRGRKFDSSLDPAASRSSSARRRPVIKGWDQGVAGMKVGGKRTLIIPSHWPTASAAPGRRIPPDSDLIFDVELLDVK
jgi:FKBP-type peptidyl-prolyl cis-trans isomerase FkpA